jgi:hypothetical protein
MVGVDGNVTKLGKTVCITILQKIRENIHFRNIEHNDVLKN